MLSSRGRRSLGIFAVGRYSIVDLMFLPDSEKPLEWLCECGSYEGWVVLGFLSVLMFLHPAILCVLPPRLKGRD